jgi:hypothetical protein
LKAVRSENNSADRAGSEVQVADKISVCQDNLTCIRRTHSNISRASLASRHPRQLNQLRALKFFQLLCQRDQSTCASSLYNHHSERRHPIIFPCLALLPSCSSLAAQRRLPLRPVQAKGSTHRMVHSSFRVGRVSVASPPDLGIGLHPPLQIAVGTLGCPQSHPTRNPLQRHRRLPPKSRRQRQLAHRPLGLAYPVRLRPNKGVNP